MKNVLVTGAGGQLGKCFAKISSEFRNFNFIFKTSKELDITDRNKLSEVFENERISICINCAAYTNVEKAETDTENAFLINAEAVKNLAEICKKQDAILVHFSTDYVFNGKANRPYVETDEVQPINQYGASKLEGEKAIQKVLSKYYIIRTSWLYSEFGHNFFNTIRKKAAEGAELNITTSQKGTPTNANDLAAFTLKILTLDKDQFGIYHFSNEGEATWFDFASAIVNLSEDKTTVNATGFYKTQAERPEYSVMSKEKISSSFGLEIPHWKDSLEGLIAEI